MLATFGHRACQFIEALLKDWARAQVTQAVNLAQVTPLCQPPPFQTHTHSKRLPKLLPNHPTICPSRPHLTPAQACGQVTHPTLPSHTHTLQTAAQVTPQPPHHLPKSPAPHPCPGVWPSLPPHPAQACAQVTHPTQTHTLQTAAQVTPQPPHHLPKSPPPHPCPGVWPSLPPHSPTPPRPGVCPSRPPNGG